MKIFVIGTRGFPGVQGGVEKHCQELYPRLAKLGCNVTVFTRSSYIPRAKRVSEWKGLKFILLWAPRRKNFETIIHTWEAYIVCALRRPDIACVHNMGPALCIPLLKLLRIKTVFTYHSINYTHQKWGRIAKLMLKAGEFLGVKFADKIIVVSKITKEYLKKKYKTKKLKFISNGVNFSETRPATDTLSRYGLQSQKYVFAASRFSPEKGLHDLIKAYMKIDNPEFKLVIAGDADYDTFYSKEIKDMARKCKGIILTGFITARPLSELYSNAGLFVLPSHYEGMPLTLLEALSYGLPVLVSDIPQHREISLPNFRYFKVKNIEELKEKTIELLAKGISEEEKCLYAKLLEEEYNWEKVAKQTLEVYKQILHRSPTLPGLS